MVLLLVLCMVLVLCGLSLIVWSAVEIFRKW